MSSTKPETNGKMTPAEETEVTSELNGLPDGVRTTPFRPPEIDVSFAPAIQSSIYSRTLDEIQNTVCEPGKNFGSMNMDELLTNLWTVEETGFISAGPAGLPVQPTPGSAALNQQGSISLPSPLCRKTVEEVWAEIHSEKHQNRGRRHLDRPVQSKAPSNRQSTFGEMTLEDFLIKAGVVREGCTHPAAAVQSPASITPQYGMSPSFGHVYGAGVVPNNGLRGDIYGYGGDENGNGGMQMVISPMSSDGMGGSGRPLDGNVFDGLVDGINGGRKRLADGAVEVVVERRQRRMIKNRESAARSRARKQAYTVELEAELNHLKEENARLREEERSVRQIRKQMIVEAMAKQACSKAKTSSEALRRCNSSPT